MSKEVERLRAWAEDEQRKRHKAEEDRASGRSEIARLRALSQNNAHSWDAIVRERNELRSEIERLRKALKDENKTENKTDPGKMAKPMTNEMIARVGKAIREADALGHSPALAAIAAMREPTEGMIARADDMLDRTHHVCSPRDVWQAMIDEARR